MPFGHHTRTGGNDMARISFTGESSESFANLLQHLPSYTVEVVPEEGEPFDAVLLGSAADELDDYFAVRVVRFNEELGEREGAPFALVVRELKVY